MSTALLIIGHQAANGIDGKLVELLSICGGDATQTLVKVAHQISQNLQKVVLNDLALDRNVSKFGSKLAGHELWMVYYEVLHEEA